MTDEELALEIHRLANELHERLLVPLDGESWLQHQLRATKLSVMSWPTWQQEAYNVGPINLPTRFQRATGIKCLE